MPTSLRRSIAKIYYRLSDVARSIKEVEFLGPKEEPVLGLLIYIDRIRCTAVDNAGVECIYIYRGKTLYII